MSSRTAPGTLILQIAYACTQDCLFCSESGPRRDFLGHPLNAREIARVLAAKKRQGYTTVIVTGGGEPTLHPRFIGILKALKESGFSVHLTSNGWGLSDPGFARRSLPFLDRVCLSIHGDTAELHDRLTRRPGSFDRLLRAFENVQERGNLLEAYTAVSRLNWERIPALLRLLSGRAKARSCVLAQLSPEGSAAPRYRDLVVPLRAWRREAPAFSALCAELELEPRFLNLPLCALGSAGARSEDRRFSPSVSVGRAFSRDAPIVVEVSRRAPSEDPEGRVHPACCSACADRAVCGGVHKSYLDAFGDGELLPRRADARCVSDRLGGNPGQWRRFFCGKEFLRSAHWTSPSKRHPSHECPAAFHGEAAGGTAFFGYPLLFLPRTPVSFDKFAAEVRPPPTAARRDEIALVDCPDTYVREELGPWLEGQSIRIAARILPSLDEPQAAAYGAAFAQIIPDYLAELQPMGAALAALPPKAVFAPAPYGVAGSRGFLRAIAAATGKLESFDLSWERLHARFAAPWRAARREAGRFRLALVACEEDLPVLLRPSFQVGVPVPRMLGEMGFRLDVLLFDTAGSRRVAASLGQTGWFDEAPGVHFFKNRTQLRRLLESGRWPAVYSDISADRRVTAAGKAPFSMALFEPGLQGALRTLDRMLGVCRSSFYGRYGRFWDGAA